MNEITAYIEKAFESVPDSERKTQIMQEIAERLEDSANALIERGKQREDAINKTIVEFGDLSEILMELRGENPDRTIASSKRALWFSVFGSLLIISPAVFINLYYSPQYIWFLYPAFAVIWWPLSLFFFGKWRKGDSGK